MQGFSEDLRSHEGLQKFTDAQNLAKSWVHAQSQLGKKRVSVPGEKATDEEWSSFYKEAGLPDLDKYEVKAPTGREINVEALKGFKEFMHKQGVFPKQAQAVYDYYLAEEKKADDAARTQVNKLVEDGLNKLKSEWGEGYSKNIALGDMALKELGGDDVIKHVVNTGLAKDPVFIKLMSKVGGLLGEDKLRGEDARRFGGQSPKEIQREIDILMARPEYADTSHPGHKRVVDDAATLYKKLYG